MAAKHPVTDVSIDFPPFPSVLEPFFSSLSISRGREHLRNGSLSGFNFFRKVHKAVCRDGQRDYYCFFNDAPPGGKRFKDIGFCTCQSGKDNSVCEHVAALVNYLYFPSGGMHNITQDYGKSLAFKIAMALCKSSSPALPLTLNPGKDVWGYTDTLGRTVLSVSHAPPGLYPDFVALPGYDIRCSTKHFSNFCKKELSGDDAKKIRFMLEVPSLQESLGPLGDFFRQFYLTAQEFKGELHYEDSEQLHILRLSPSGASWRVECLLQPEQAWVLFRNNGQSISLGESAQIHGPAYKKLYMLGFTESGQLEIVTHLAQGSSLIPSLEKERPGFGDARYVPGQGFYATEVKDSLTSRRFCGWNSYIIQSKDLPAFLKKFHEELQDPELYIKGPEISAMLKRAHITGIQLSIRRKLKSRYLFGIRLQLGTFTLDIRKLAEEISLGQACIFTPCGWLDLEDPSFFWLRSLRKEDLVAHGGRGYVWMGRSRALRVFSFYNQEIIDFDPAPYPALRALKPSPVSEDDIAAEPGIGHLRNYQKEGLRWLINLYQNAISGILADEMGLGKTHQAMALIQRIVRRQNDARILVVCPTSVIYHWRDKFAQFYPDVSVALYHSQQRQWDETVRNFQVLVTSYGIVRKDIELMKAARYNLLVLDEIQLAKNHDTEIYKSLNQLQAGAWIGLSGTPIENSVWELKNIFDLILPGYFPEAKEFAEEIARPLNEADSSLAQAYLLRLIRPFMLRREKAEVLTDLPDKVEEIYKCEMPDSQRRLYDGTYEEKESNCVADLKNESIAVPYMHIFALLTLLKQICNHPGSLETAFSRHQEFESGKWNLCRELLQNALESGLKVVIFSQYLNMLSIMESYLQSSSIRFAILTGATKKRDQVLKTFREDEACKVFLCSLKAGGMGIDLTAASVVIHYDRWWNAAREDQATSRVHRIGQQRNVQVYKLVTLDSIEERIDAIIARKANLSDSLLGADLTQSLKLFSREELLEILTPGMK